LIEIFDKNEFIQESLNDFPYTVKIQNSNQKQEKIESFGNNLTDPSNSMDNIVYNGTAQFGGQLLTKLSDNKKQNEQVRTSYFDKKTNDQT
jgi:hypothetical protein